MSKVITSPVKRWPGTVTLADPLSFPQAIAVEEALDTVRDSDNPSRQEINHALLPAIMGCVEKWNLEGMADPPDPFPATPSVSSAQLLSWLFREVTALFMEDTEVPNA
jgi:hypothetical protein